MEKVIIKLSLLQENYTNACQGCIFNKFPDDSINPICHEQNVSDILGIRDCGMYNGDMYIYTREVIK